MPFYGYRGNYNTAVGSQAMGDTNTTNRTGSNNVAVGHLALAHVTTGTGNAGIGKQVLSSITTGSNNVAVGRKWSYIGGCSRNSICIGNAQTSSDNHVRRSETPILSGLGLETIC